MRTGTLVAAVTGSGLLGGIAGALLVQEIAGPPVPRPAPASSAAEVPARDPDLAKEVAALRARLEEMQASAQAASEDSARLRSALEKETKAAAEARTRIEGLEARASRSMTALPGGVTLGGLAERGQVAFVGSLPAEASPGVADRIRKSLELRQKPEADRWAAAREALGLSGGQEEDLKAAIKERDEAIQSGLKITADVPQDGSAGASLTVSAPDVDKLREARKKYDDRVNTTLTADQAKRWREEGYEDAFRGPAPLAVRSVRVNADANAEPAK